MMLTNAKSAGVLRKPSCDKLVGNAPHRRTSIDECVALLMPQRTQHATVAALLPELKRTVDSTASIGDSAESVQDDIKDIMAQFHSDGYADNVKRERLVPFPLESVPENRSIDNCKPLSKHCSSALNRFSPVSTSPRFPISPGKARWNLVRDNLKRVIEYGASEEVKRRRRKTGEAARVVVVTPKPTEALENSFNEEILEKRKDNELDIPVYDAALIYEAIPHLPFGPALACLLCNVVLPGSGTVLSGFFLLCCGQPRLQAREGRITLSIIVNTLVGISQFCTITFLLVGWFWSIAWGVHFVYHSDAYRRARKEKRQADVATAALEAITKDSLTRRSTVQVWVQEENLLREQSGDNKQHPNRISRLMRQKLSRTVAPCRRSSDAASGLTAAQFSTSSCEPVNSEEIVLV